MDIMRLRFILLPEILRKKFISRSFLVRRKLLNILMKIDDGAGHAWRFDSLLQRLVESLTTGSATYFLD